MIQEAILVRPPATQLDTEPVTPPARTPRPKREPKPAKRPTLEEFRTLLREHSKSYGYENPLHLCDPQTEELITKLGAMFG